MGTTQKTIMALRLLVLVVALAVYKCDALPSKTDLVVPEGMMMQVAFSSMTPTAFISATTKSGGSKAECGTFARTTVQDITNAVSSEQGVLDAVDTGDSCAALGQDEVQAEEAKVAAAKVVVQDAEAVVVSKEAAKEAAASATYEVTFDLMSTEQPTCMDITGQSSYQAVKNTHDGATAELAEANQAVVNAKTTLTDAETALALVVAEASRLMSGCLCRVQKQQTAAWTAVTSAHLSNAADWKQAHEVLCALDSGTTSCNFDACPAVTKPTVATGVENADAQHCTPEPTKAPTKAPTKTPTRPPASCTMHMAGHTRTCYSECNSGTHSSTYDNCGTSVRVTGNCREVWVYDNDNSPDNVNFGAVHGSRTISLPYDLSSDCAGFYLVPGY